ncbi:MAG: hypothetical protein M0T84_14745 [Betaproteobacteria bacterium]|nr:hypothetical protein [Betaproteobacteria bacterium]
MLASQVYFLAVAPTVPNAGTQLKSHSNISVRLARMPLPEHRRRSSVSPVVPGEGKEWRPSPRRRVMFLFYQNSIRRACSRRGDALRRTERNAPWMSRKMQGGRKGLPVIDGEDQNIGRTGPPGDRSSLREGGAEVFVRDPALARERYAHHDLAMQIHLIQFAFRVGLVTAENRQVVHLETITGLDLEAIFGHCSHSSL